MIELMTCCRSVREVANVESCRNPIIQIENEGGDCRDAEQLVFYDGRALTEDTTAPRADPYGSVASVSGDTTGVQPQTAPSCGNGNYRGRWYKFQATGNWA
jgi:hypothetical protein